MSGSSRRSFDNIRVVGGSVRPRGLLLVGLKNGAVFKIFIDNRFPVKLIKHVAPVRCS